jgi:nicotinate-nucleotide--dimethylbenzimidazole phosphoribosyltransferase
LYSNLNAKGRRQAMGKDNSSINTKAALELREFLDSRCITDGGLGLMADYLERLAGIQGTMFPETSPWAVLIFAADHGVVSEGVSQFSGSDSVRMLRGILCGQTAVGVLAAYHHIPLVCWDIGLCTDVEPEHTQMFPLVRAKVALGTRNFEFGPAMTSLQCQSALATGRQAVCELPSHVKLIALGEMGMGNTTSAAALTAALLNQLPEKVVGRGAGNNRLGLKQEIVAKALLINSEAIDDPLDALTALGGLEIAALTGACLEAAATGKGIVLDGFVTSIAALIATRLDPRVKDHLFASHLAPEPGHQLILAELGLRPPLTLDLRIGEGAGGLLLYPLLNQAAVLLNGLTGFQELGIDKGYREEE